MKAPNTYTTKAELYARYRWDYAPAALEALFASAWLGPAATIIDLAAGTGILTRRLHGRAGRLLAIEPDPLMALFARLDDRPPHGRPAIHTVRANPEAIPHPTACPYLVTVAQATHWFDPEPARAEIRRILRPGGWLALFHNRPRNPKIDQALDQALAALAPEPVDPLPFVSPSPVSTERNPAPLPSHRPASQSPEYYFAGHVFERQVFPFRFQQDFAAYLGGNASASYNPTPGEPTYPAFAQAVRGVFDRFADPNGQIEIWGETILVMGQL